MSGRGFDGGSVPGAKVTLVPTLKGLPHDKAAEKLEQVARGHRLAIKELSDAAQAAAKRADAAEAAAPRVFADITLLDGVETTVLLNLSRKPKFVRESCPRGGIASGCVVVVPSVDAVTPYDEAKYLVLKATGWGAAIVVDVEVTP